MCIKIQFQLVISCLIIMIVMLRLSIAKLVGIPLRLHLKVLCFLHIVKTALPGSNISSAINCVVIHGSDESVIKLV